MATPPPPPLGCFVASDVLILPWSLHQPWDVGCTVPRCLWGMALCILFHTCISQHSQHNLSLIV